jgi:transposase
MRFTIRHLEWVPHKLSDAHKKLRVDISRQLLDVIAHAKHQSWKFFLTGDESWFYFQTDYTRVWLLPESEPPKRVRQTINTQEAMVTIFWSPLGFPILEALGKRKTFASDYFYETIAPQFVEYAPMESRQARGRRLTIHMDNASPHRSKQTTDFLSSLRLISAPHPPHSPDLAPSDFYLFGKVKNLLMGKEFESADETLQAIARIVHSIPRSELDSVFKEWERR